MEHYYWDTLHGADYGFNAVAETYEHIKPVNERHWRKGKSRDIRPLGNRNNKFDKIRKVDSDTYVFLDGGYGDPITFFGHEGDGENKYKSYEDYSQQELNEMVEFAPIVWRRHAPDLLRSYATETITIRNHSSDYNAAWRLKFLRTYLPYSLTVPPVQHGKEYVKRVGVACKGVYLAKSKAIPELWQKQNMGNKEHYPYKDNSAITFERALTTKRLGRSKTLGEMKAFILGNQWVWISGGEDDYRSRVRVDKEVKKKYADAIEDYWQYTVRFAAFIDDTREERRAHCTALQQHVLGYDDSLSMYINFSYTLTNMEEFDVTKARDIVTNDQNDFRIHLLYYFLERRPLLSELRNLQYNATEEEVRKVRSQFVSFMNEWLGVLYTVEELVQKAK